MKLNIEAGTINWNWGLGWNSPVSLFLYLNSDGITKPLEDIYESVKSSGVTDILFYGDFSEVTTLNWLTVKLLSEGYFVSAIMKAQDEAVQILYSSRIIITLCLSDLKDLDISGLTENDYIIINENSVSKILAVISRLEGLNIQIGRLYFNSMLLSREDALNDKLFEIFPYDGGCLEE